VGNQKGSLRIGEKHLHRLSDPDREDLVAFTASRMGQNTEGVFIRRHRAPFSLTQVLVIEDEEGLHLNLDHIVHEIGPLDRSELGTGVKSFDLERILFQASGKLSSLFLPELTQSLVRQASSAMGSGRIRLQRRVHHEVKLPVLIPEIFEIESRTHRLDFRAFFSIHQGIFGIL
jgi:hypothetical protein